MSEIIYDRRRMKRQEDSNEISVTVLPDGKNFPEKTVFHNYSKDISVFGARIRSDIILPVNTSISMEMKLKTMYPMIITYGKVKWIKPVNDKSFEAGIEFSHTSKTEILKLARYLSWQRNFSVLFPFYT
jgi:hypothetical protein